MNQDDAIMNRNVGTPGAPVTFLHQRAVALLYDELTRPAIDEPEVKARLTPGGDWSHDLRAGVKSVKIPGEWDQVGGIVPDLILYGEDTSKPLRIIEVVVSNPPDKLKQEKLDTIARRDVDVVVVKVEKGEDLMGLCRVTQNYRFTSLSSLDYPHHANGQYLRRQHDAKDQMVKDLIIAIASCSPPLRRDLRNLLNQLDTLDSLYPIRPTNPLKDQLTVE